MTAEQATALLVAMGGLVTAIAGLIGAVAVLYGRVEANRRAINGRMDELVQTARVAGHAEGVALAQQLQHPEQRDDC